MKRSRLPRACKRVTPPPCSNTVPKRSLRNIRKNREAAMASITQDESTREGSNPAVTGARRTVSTSAEVSTEHTAVTATFNTSSPSSSSTLSSTSFPSVCYTTMVHDEPLAAESTCSSTMPHTKGRNGIRKLYNHSHIAYPLRPPVRDFGTQTELLQITDNDIIFLKNLKAKRMDISKINVIVKNNEYIVSYIEPEESYRWEYLRMQNEELPYDGLAQWERNQMQLEAFSLLDLQNLNPNINVP